jgi:phosphoenolpyruvate synthase/pyruvate phosphate dikinase
VCDELTDILEAIQSCWASLYTLQSVQYRRWMQQTRIFSPIQE